MAEEEEPAIGIIRECVALCDRPSTFECPACKAPSCAECPVMFMLARDDPEKTKGRPSCVKCGGEFSEEMMVEFPRKAIDGPVRQKRQRSLTESSVNQHGNAEAIQKAASEVKKRMKQQDDYWQDVVDRGEAIAKKKKKLDALVAKRVEIEGKEKKLRESLALDREMSGGITRSFINGALDRNQEFVDDDDDDGIAKKTSFFCPVRGCAGTVVVPSGDNTQAKCLICHGNACVKCRSSVVDAHHDCDEDVVASIQFIERNTRSCPSCNRPIQRSYGCDQMWCTGCRSAFCYRTGKKIENLRNLHNPEYFAWRQQTQQEGRQEEDAADAVVNRCDEMLMMPVIPTDIGRWMGPAYDRIRRYANSWTDDAMIVTPTGMSASDSMRTAVVRFKAGEIDETELGRRLYLVKKDEEYTAGKQQIAAAAMTAVNGCVDDVCGKARKAVSDFGIGSDELERMLVEIDKASKATLDEIAAYFTSSFLALSKKHGRSVHVAIEREETLWTIKTKRIRKRPLSNNDGNANDEAREDGWNVFTSDVA